MWDKVRGARAGLGRERVLEERGEAWASIW